MTVCRREGGVANQTVKESYVRDMIGTRVGSDQDRLSDKA